MCIDYGDRCYFALDTWKIVRWVCFQLQVLVHWQVSPMSCMFGSGGHEALQRSLRKTEYKQGLDSTEARYAEFEPLAIYLFPALVEVNSSGETLRD